MQYKQHQWCFSECLVVHTYHKHNKIDHECLLWSSCSCCLWVPLAVLRLEVVNSVEAKVPTSTELRSHADDACGPACSPWPATDTEYPTPCIVNFFRVFAMTAWTPLSRVSAGSRNNSVAHRQPHVEVPWIANTRKKMFFFSTLIEATTDRSDPSDSSSMELWGYRFYGVSSLRSCEVKGHSCFKHIDFHCLNAHKFLFHWVMGFRVMAF